MNDAFNLNGSLALVTGGGTGLGLGTCRAIVAAGGRVVMTGRRIEPLATACAELGDAAGFIQHDLTDLATIPALVRDIEQRYGAIDILVNNAGNHIKKPAVEHTDAEFKQVLDTHVFGSFAMTRECGRGMLDRGRGSIVMILSMTSLIGQPLVVAYGAAKSALQGMVRNLATEFSPRGVRVNGIAPGWIDTAMVRKAIEGDPQRKQKILGRTPMGTLGQPEDIGNTVVFLSSPAARFITGAVLPVDGGAAIGF
jgi:gluconate 5-dehydrogenase